MEVDTRINEHFTAGEVKEEYEGMTFKPADPSKDHFICDFCSKGVPYTSNPRIGHYVADDVLNETHPRVPQIRRERPLVTLASYCPECTTRQLLFPCEDFAEVRILFDLREDRTMENVEVTDVSARESGIPWDPKEVSERITGISFVANAFLAGDDHLWGPENMVTFFLSVVDGVDIRELVKYDGSLDPKVLGRARKTYEEFKRKMRKTGHSRKSFRDHVRGG